MISFLLNTQISIHAFASKKRNTYKHYSINSAALQGIFENSLDFGYFHKKRRKNADFLSPLPCRKKRHWFVNRFHAGSSVIKKRGAAASFHLAAALSPKKTLFVHSTKRDGSLGCQRVNLLTGIHTEYLPRCFNFHRIFIGSINRGIERRISIGVLSAFKCRRRK